MSALKTVETELDVKVYICELAQQLSIATKMEVRLLEADKALRADLEEAYIIGNWDFYDLYVKAEFELLKETFVISKQVHELIFALEQASTISLCEFF